MSTPAVKNLYQRMSAIMNDVHKIVKGGRMQGSGGNYSYAKHDDIAEALRGPMIDHGVLCLPSIISHDFDRWETQGPNGTRVTFQTTLMARLRFQNVDDRDDFFEIDAVGYGLDPQDKGPGKAFSYAVKTGMLKAFTLPCGEDTDDAAHERPTAAPQRSTRKPTVPKGASAENIERDKLWNELKGLGDRAGYSGPEIRAWVEETYETLKLTDEQLLQAISKMKDRVQELGK